MLLSSGKTTLEDMRNVWDDTMDLATCRHIPNAVILSKNIIIWTNEFSLFYYLWYFQSMCVPNKEMRLLSDDESLKKNKKNQLHSMFSLFLSSLSEDI